MPLNEVVVSESDTSVHDVAPEIVVHELTVIAAALCRAPHAAAMLLGHGGWEEVGPTPSASRRRLSPALRRSTIQASPDLFIVEDLLQTNLVDDTAQSLVSSGVRFYAGVACLHPDGTPLGLLYVTDQVPRVLTADQESALGLLANQLRARVEASEQRQRLHRLEQDSARTLAQLRASEVLFRTFMDASPFLSYIKDAAGRLLFYNRTYAHRFGISSHAWLGRTDDSLWARPTTATRQSDLEVMRGGLMVQSEEPLHARSGELTHWRTYRFPTYDSTGNLLLAGFAVDVTHESQRAQEVERFQQEMQQANEQLRRLSVTDELTGLRNRRAFEERLVLEFSISRRRNRDLAVLLLDVDDFKKINDLSGHDAGDAVLRRLASILRTTIRLPDMVARYGGEEFIVLLPESNAAAGLGFAKRLMTRMASEPWDREPVTISVGLSCLNDNILNAFQMVSQADEALYQAKRTGKNRIVLHGDSPAT